MKQQTQKLKISPTGKEILDFLRSRGGASSVGIIGSNRTITIRHLRRLESLGLIECLDAPEVFKSRPDIIGMEGKSLTCGVWRLADGTDNGVGNSDTIASYETNKIVRMCSFCHFKAPYDEFPEGSICFLGICACGDCLERVETEDFRALLAEEEAINQMETIQK
ncbi:MAG: hypothetical protein ABWZ66_04440 [Pyrinomonadaceae bacterium]